MNLLEQCKSQKAQNVHWCLVLMAATNEHLSLGPVGLFVQIDNENNCGIYIHVFSCRYL